MLTPARQSSWNSHEIRGTVLAVKRIGIVLVVMVAVLGFVLLALYFTNRPPTEARIIANFVSHRATYERLRDMLTADDKLLRVADWGIETDSGFGETA